jgi:hypothetical protein
VDHSAHRLGASRRPSGGAGGAHGASSARPTPWSSLPAGRSRSSRTRARGAAQPQAGGRSAVRAAVRLSRLPTRMLRWWAADERRTRGMSTRSPPELVAARLSAKGNIRHRLRRLETQGVIVMTRTPGGNTARVSLTAAGRPKALKLTGSDAEGEAIQSNNRCGAVPWHTELGRGADTAPTHRRSVPIRPGEGAHMRVARHLTRP